MSANFSENNIGEPNNSTQLSWDKLGFFILQELKRLNKIVDKTQEDISEIKTQMDLVKFKVSLYGLIAGSIPGVLAAIVWFIVNYVK